MLKLNEVAAAHAKRLAIFASLVLCAAATGAAPAAATASLFTVAGGGAGPNEGGLATGAALSFPTDVAEAPDGGFVFSDQLGNQIRRVAPDGKITTIAGTGTGCAVSTAPCGDGGGATAAQLNFPGGLVITPSGGVLFADVLTHRIRLISSYTGGTISTVAGNGDDGFGGDGGPALAARFDTPIDVVLLPDGSYAVSDRFNSRIRRISSIGAGATIETIAGSGPTGCCGGSFGGEGVPATSAVLYNPNGLAPTPDGGLLIADSGNFRVRKLSSATTGGMITTIAGTGGAADRGDGLPATQADLEVPGGVAVAPDGSYLITTTSRVRRVAPGGRITTVAGGGNVVIGDLTEGMPATALSGAVFGHGIVTTSDGGILWAARNLQRIFYLDAKLRPTPTPVAAPVPAGPAGPVGPVGPAGSPGAAGKNGSWVNVTCSLPAAKKGSRNKPKPSCKVTTLAAGAKVSLTLRSGKKQVASASRTLKGTSATITLTGPKAVKSGSYRLRIEVEFLGGKVTTEQPLRLR